MAQKHKSSPLSGSIRFSISHEGGEVQAVYLKISDAAVSKSVEVGEFGEAVIDLDKGGNVVGLEMLEPGSLTVKVIRSIKKQFGSAFDHIDIGKLQHAFA